MSSNKYNKIYKSWSDIDELTLIKEVVLQGENIDLCKQYLSYKRKVPLAEYEIFFKDVVDNYIQHLLSDKLICKAENVLTNMKRNANCILFQFAQECNNDNKEFILNYIRQQNGQQSQQVMNDLQFQWDVVQQMKTNKELETTVVCYMKQLTFESFMELDFAVQQRLLIELHYAGITLNVIDNIFDKNVLWDYLLEIEKTCEIIRWCTIQQNLKNPERLMVLNNEWSIKYRQWSLGKDMYEKAIKVLSANTDECLRNCFIKSGYIFYDELNDPKTVLQRISITNSCTSNESYLNGLQLSHLIWEKELYYLLLQDIVSIEELRELGRKTLEKEKHLINLITCLKKCSTKYDIHDIIMMSENIQLYLQSLSSFNRNDILLISLFHALIKLTTSCDSLDSVQVVPMFTCEKDHFQLYIEELHSASYSLMKSLHGLDVKLLQSTVNIFEIFKPINQSMDQQKEVIESHHLNYLHYVKQSRSTYAIYTFIIDYLNNYGSIRKTHLWAACQSVYALCMKMASDDDTIIHSIAFCEMLGFDTQYLRCLLKLIRNLNKQQMQDNTLSNLIKIAEQKIIASISKNINQKFPLNDFKAIMMIKSKILCPMDKNVTCIVYSEILYYYASNNDFWRFLVLIQYFEMPVKAVKVFCKYFKSKMIGDHLLRALSNYYIINERKQQQQLHVKSQKSNGHMVTSTTSIDTTSSGLFCNERSFSMSISNGHHNSLLHNNITTTTPDIFAFILLNTKQTVLSEHFIDVETFFESIQTYQHNNERNGLLELLKCSIDYDIPLLTILAASINPLHNIHAKWCWLVWLTVTTRQWQDITTLAVTHNEDFPWNLIELLIKNAQLKALLRSFYIFYPDNAIVHLFRFLDLTRQLQFDDTVIHELRLYGLALTNDEIQIPFIPSLVRKKLMVRSTYFLLLHLQYNFNSAIDQQEFLSCICKSGLYDITGQLDFCLLGEFHKILNFNDTKDAFHMKFDFIDLMESNGRITSNRKYEQILNFVLEAKQYSTAVSLAILLEKPVGNIIYNKWINSLEMHLQIKQSTEKWDDFNLPLDQYEEDVSKYSLPPETLVNFLLHVTSCLPTTAYRQRYLILQKSLNIIKYHHLFPNESFDRDQIEYDMILSYISLAIDNDTEEKERERLPIYYSEYYEQIMMPERGVLYKSFWELKELAGIDDLNIRDKLVINAQQYQRLENLILRLLDEGDIVEALRLQELFQARPIDLRLIVFCMALAEGLSTVQMPPDELQLFASFENAAFSKFNKRTLSTVVNDSLVHNTTNLSRNETPYKEKQRILTVLQGIASKIKHGLTLAKRIICVFRAAMYLDKEYIDILRTKDIQILLQSVAKEDCSHRLLVVSDILTSTQMGSEEVAELLAFEITAAVIRPCFYICNNDAPSKTISACRKSDLWGYDVDRDLHLFLELTPDRIKLGTCLLEYCDALSAYRQYRNDSTFVGNTYFERLLNIISRTSKRDFPVTTTSNSLLNKIEPFRLDQTSEMTQILSHKKQNIIYIELLIKAHQCFVHECSMEGIANVLKRAKTLNLVLTKAKSWRLIVRFLTGIGRYREMSYCFDALIANEQFESLLGQFDEDKNHGLRQAILAYLREYSPPEQGKELFKLAALHFLMYKELAEFWQQDAQTLLMKIYTTSHVQFDANYNNKEVIQLRVEDNTITLLNRCLEYYIHATENYILDNKFLAAQNCAMQAELVALQIDLARKALDRTSSSLSLSELNVCDCVICLTSREQFKNFINYKLRVPQSLILSRAYNYDVNWSEALLQQFIIKLKRSYLDEFLLHVDISDDIIENVSKSFHMYSQQQQTNQQMEQHLLLLIDLVKSVTLKYKLASMVSSGKTAVMELINDNTIHYLRDINFGRHDENRIS